MDTDDKKNNILDRRTLLLSGFKIFVFGSLTWRLFDLQLFENKKYKKLSENNQFNYSLVLPERGQILDRKNRVLAGNMDSFSLILNWNEGLDLEKIIYKINSIINISNKEKESLLKRVSETKIKKVKSKNFFITKNLSQKEVSKLAVRIFQFPELKFAMTKKRVYPQGGIASHVTGYTGVFSNSDLDNKNTLNAPGLDVGKSGLEKYFDFKLRGNFGRKRDEVTAKGFVIDSNLYETPISGKNLKTSIDLNIQSFALDRLEKGNSKIVPAKIKKIEGNTKKTKIINDFVYINKNNKIVPPETGSVVIMDVKNGQIICSVSTPYFNPNIFSRGLNINEWNEIKNNTRSPLLNRSVAGLYPPGSTIKMAVALAALESEVISYKSKFFCNGLKEFGNMKFHCWAKHGHGSINLSQAIERSCDVFFYELGLKVGIEKISKMLKRLGLGNISNLELNETREGLIPNKKWKLKEKGLNWTPGETINSSIGQGYMLASPIQLATMTARIANAKYAVQPTLLLENNQTFKKLNINSNHLKFVKDAMFNVVNNKRGTAHRSRIVSDKINMAGKTGTVQVVRISETEREKGIVKNIDRKWEKRDHALFVGYAPVEDPKYAISVVVEHGGSGSGTAAPIARDIFMKLFNI